MPAFLRIIFYVVVSPHKSGIPIVEA